jgi:polyhydroxyalkanoate synthesis repressor PhaR
MTDMLVSKRYGVNTEDKNIAVQHDGGRVKSAQVVIKKYGNRRLYDTSSSRYVNLEEIGAMVRDGTDVRVVDAGSGEDLTRFILTQIIAENAKDKPTGLSLELLRQLIVASDHVGQEFIMWYLKSAFDAYQKLQSTIHGGISGVQEAALSPLSMMKKFVQQKEQPRLELSTELDRLKQQLAEVESRLQGKPEQKTRPKARVKESAKKAKAAAQGGSRSSGKRRD